MDHSAAERFVRSLFQHILGRTPRPEELDHWVGRTAAGAADQIFSSFVASKEYRHLLARQKAANRVKARHPPGHFYSPIVDPVEARKYIGEVRPTVGQKLVDLPGIRIDNQRMLEFWQQISDGIQATSFSAPPPGASTEASPGVSTDRYYWPNPSYPLGDALILRAMIQHWRPARIVEVGCGFSSACMLDAADQANLENFSMTCIDPRPERLSSLLRPADLTRVQIIKSPVQEVALDVFAALGPHDILFIDSTHVLKTGSDVCYELFSVLPSLAPGVIVHFHDCRYPFEYPEKWIFKYNYSWNEIYALRAFLMFNSDFEILFWNSYFAVANPDLVRPVRSAMAGNPGGAIWIQRRGRGNVSR